jgi:hypothetical protein
MPSRTRAPHLLMVRGSTEYGAWMDRLASAARAGSRAALVERALADLAKRLKHEPAPRRAGPPGTNRFGEPSGPPSQPGRAAKR